MGYLCHTTAYNVDIARSNASLRAAYSGSLLNLPDGMPLVWIGRRLGYSAITRVYGPDLLEAVSEAGRATGLRHFYYGGAPGVTDALAASVLSRFPGLQVAGTFTPPFRELTAPEFTAFAGCLAETHPDVLWVGVGSPKQEEFMARHWKDLDAGILVGVGAAFDFLSGRIPQAPRWMRQSGLEWLFRLGTEPRRLWRRYLVHNPRFAFLALRQLARRNA